ncbi:MAG: MCE family protein [Ignavibacteriae bacterium]|nr:MAG: MCE family protein [Ignavibacteriota bacterium]
MKNLSSLKVGITVFIGLIIFFVFIFIVGNESNTFSDTYDLKLFVDNVEGLAEGSMVTLGGLKVGSVKAIEFDNQNGKNGITVTLNLNERFRKQVTKNSEATIKTIGLLGDKYIDVSIGQQGQVPLSENDYLPVKQSMDLASLASDVKTALNDFSSTVSEIKLVLNDVNEGRGTLGKFVKDPAVYDGLNNFVGSMNSVAGAIQGRKGFLGRAIYDPVLYEQIASVTTDLKIVTDSLKYGKGTLGKLIMDDKLFAQMNDFTDKANELISKTQDTTSTVGALLNENEAYGRINELLAQLRLLIADIKKNPGRYFSISIF